MDKTDYAKEISRKYGLPYADVLNMTLREINQIEAKKYEEELAKRMENENTWKKIKILFHDYQWFKEKLGDALDRALFKQDENNLFGYQSKPVPGINYEDEEMKNLFMRDTSGSGYYWGSSHQDRYLNIKSWSHVHCVISDALVEKFPILIQYSPYVDTLYSDEEWRDCSIHFDLKEPKNPDNYNELDCIETDDYEEDEVGYKQIKFTCRFTSLINGDISAMVEDYLSGRSMFYSIKSKNNEEYKKQNELLNSKLMTKFFNDVINMRKE